MLKEQLKQLTDIKQFNCFHLDKDMFCWEHPLSTIHTNPEKWEYVYSFLHIKNSVVMTKLCHKYVSEYPVEACIGWQ